MNPSRKKRFSVVLAMTALVSTSCSLKNDSPSSGSLKIVLQRNGTSSAIEQLLSGATSSSATRIAALKNKLPRLQTATPTSVDDFDCFGVNVTGPGISADGSLNGCEDHDNFHGRGLGILSDDLTVRGESVELDVPSGRDRNIEVFGIYPPTIECGGDPADDVHKVYFLGGVTKDLGDNTEVTIPISFNSTPASLTCTDSETNEYEATLDGTSNKGFETVGCVEYGTTLVAAPDVATVAFSAAQNTAAADIDISSARSECGQFSTENSALQEFSFSISPDTVPFYDNIGITWVGAAGVKPASCDGFSAPTVLSESAEEPLVQIYNDFNSAWEDVGSASLDSDNVVFTDFSPIADYVHNNAIRVRVLGGGASSSHCSIIDTDYVEAWFH